MTHSTQHNGTYFVASVIAIWRVTVSILIINLALLGLPVFTSLAIVRYHLYDVDLITNCILVVGAHTALLALVISEA